MIITKKSMFTGKMNSMDLDVNEVDYANWEAGMLIQKAMPYLSAGQREFLLTGATQEEWGVVMGEDE